MQRSVFNCATFRVANTTDMSGRATADEINHSLRTEKRIKLWRIAYSTCLGPLLVAGLFIVLAPMPGRADDDKDKRPGHEDNDKGIRAEIAALQATVSTLQGQVSALQTANTHQQNEINSLQTSNTTLQTQLAAVQSNKALALGPFVSVDPNPEIGVVGPNIIFTGANIHIVSGSGVTNEGSNPRGLGNLIIGYDEDPKSYFRGFDGGPEGGFPLSPGDRGGSHNLVIGEAHRFTRAAYGGLVAGVLNTIDSIGASVSGGYANTASGGYASVSGGGFNTASGEYASVSGGGGNGASGTNGSVSGGLGNTAGGYLASVTGGFGNHASGSQANVSGGMNNTASGSQASVSGGTGNTAGGLSTVVIGGQNVTDNNNFSIAPQPPFP
jgi:hypothetical protein